jgi:acetyl esterase
MNKDLTKDRMPIDADLRKYLDEVIPPSPSTSNQTNEEVAQTRRILMMKILENRDFIRGLPNRVAARDVTISGGPSLRLYMPPDCLVPLPVLVYLHGGGWVVGSIETHDPFCRLMSEAAGVIILSVDYRLAPEYPFSAGLDDALTAFRWAASHAQSFGGDPQRLMMGGDSAGGNLAAVAANRICSVAHGVGLRALMLLYPVTDHPSAEHASYTENGTGYGLDAGLMHWFWEQYAQGVSPNNPDLSPLRLQDVPALPPTLVATAEYDPLRDEGVAYAEKLKAAGIPVTHLHAPDMHHNFPVHPGTVARFPQSVLALNDFAAWLRNVAPSQA